MKAGLAGDRLAVDKQDNRTSCEASIWTTAMRMNPATACAASEPAQAWQQVLLEAGISWSGAAICSPLVTDWPRCLRWHCRGMASRSSIRAIEESPAGASGSLAVPRKLPE